MSSNVQQQILKQKEFQKLKFKPLVTASSATPVPVAPPPITKTSNTLFGDRKLANCSALVGRNLYNNGTGILESPFCGELSAERRVFCCFEIGNLLLLLVIKLLLFNKSNTTTVPFCL